jgi:hypothetical protein
MSGYDRAHLAQSSCPAGVCCGASASGPAHRGQARWAIKVGEGEGQGDDGGDDDDDIARK